MKQLNEIVRESVESFRQKIYEPVHEEGVTCWCKPIVTGEGTSEANIMTITHNEERDLRTRDFLSSQISLLEAELERKKGMMKDYKEQVILELESDDSMWNSGYKSAVYEDITYPESEIEKIKELI